ncbi:MAG: hypothetical protein H6818_09545 [Phycisphaerales bacterium]|nr:hypothetical protein [Phycisphaerales bacterium]MCB9864103.1 hypothetical protein [Phycisphaerales bacterium]
MRGIKNPLFLLAVAAVVLGTTVVVVVMRDEDPDYSTEDIFPEVVHPDPELIPKFKFPDELRTTDLEVNRFIDRFFRICGEGKYSEFKLMYTSQPGQEIPPARFESTFNVLKEARITQLRRLPDLKQFEGPTWLIVAEFDLEKKIAAVNEYAGNVIRLVVGKEGGRLKIRPITRDAVEQIEAHEARMRAAASAAANTSDTPTP